MKIFVIACTLLVFVGCTSSNKPASTTTDVASQQATAPASSVNSHEESTQGLPEKATSLVKEHFGAQEIKTVQKFNAPRPSGTLYEVKLADQTELDFDINGEWIEIDGHQDNPISISYLNPSILTYLTTNYPNIGVLTVERTQKGFELELANDTDLYFDSNGVFQRMEN
ncbi:PepSY-like domain-containing protein [Sphingobacterium hungaricum]|uniref:Putative beta-lactamase-inhibitor-like PepSY-like domain-containing protein n=1 Tax=Sphingobacterium hungaricum TaxID=2082723 RepID=A0A928UYT5_9SPHI|nr:PepSY-like domain-containing protein [Sphingobacterium hungaricum]MBE8714543.1 hypothetical protein [Sphingobacterium hungaricum]